MNRSGCFRLPEKGVRLLESREAEDGAKVEWLRGATQEGIDAMEHGEYVTLDSPKTSADHLSGLPSGGLSVMNDRYTSHYCFVD